MQCKQIEIEINHCTSLFTLLIYKNIDGFSVMSKNTPEHQREKCKKEKMSNMTRHTRIVCLI